MSGYRPYRVKEVVKEHGIPEGSDPFRATVLTTLSFEEIDSIAIDGDRKWNDLFAAMAPMVVAWNLTARVSGTNEYEPIPPPAEAGPDVFRALEPKVTAWLAMKIRAAQYEIDDLPKESTPSAPTPGGPNEPGSDSPTPGTS